MNKMYLKHLLKKNKKLVMIQFLILIALYCYVNINPFSNNIFIHMGLFGLKDIIKLYLYACVMIYPIYLIAKNYKQNGIDFHLSLPITKEKRYRNELMFGWLIIFIPYLTWILINHISVNLYIESQSGDSALLRYLLIIFPTTLIFLLNCLIAIKSNHLFDAVTIIIITNLIIFIFPYVFDIFFSMNSTGRSLSVVSDVYFNNNRIYTESINFTSFLFLLIGPYQFVRNLMYGEFNMYMLMSIIIYVMMIVVLLFLNLITYKNKKSEDFGTKKSNRYIYSSIICLITFMFLLLVISQARWIVLCIWLVSIFCFYIASFCIAERKISISIKKILVYLLLIACAITFRITYVYTHGFERLHSYRSIEKIENIKIYANDTTLNLNVDVAYDKQKKEIAKAELINIQDELVDKYCDDNLWWKAEESDAYSYLNVIYDGNETEDTGMTYLYYVDPQIHKDIMQRLESVGFDIKEY